MKVWFLFYYRHFLVHYITTYLRFSRFQTDMRVKHPSLTLIEVLTVKSDCSRPLLL